MDTKTMAERIFERKIYQKMLKWKKESNGKTALLIKGAMLVSLLLLRNLLKKSTQVIF